MAGNRSARIAKLKKAYTQENGNDEAASYSQSQPDYDLNFPNLSRGWNSTRFQDQDNPNDQTYIPERSPHYDDDSEDSVLGSVSDTESSPGQIPHERPEDEEGDLGAALRRKSRVHSNRRTARARSYGADKRENNKERVRESKQKRKDKNASSKNKTASQKRKKLPLSEVRTVREYNSVGQEAYWVNCYGKTGRVEYREQLSFKRLAELGLIAQDWSQFAALDDEVKAKKYKNIFTKFRNAVKDKKEATEVSRVEQAASKSKRQRI